MVKSTDYEPELVDLIDVPAGLRQLVRVWKARFDALPSDKAVMLKYNTRQRAHQIVSTIRSEAKYWKASISTRVIHAEPAIHGTDGWLVYFWRRQEEVKQ